MAINFNNLSETQFEQMCKQLILLENPEATPVDPSRGDEGLDTFVGAIDGVVEVDQFKHFPGGFNKSRRDQTRRSLTKTVMKHKPSKWSLYVSCDPDPETLRWLEKQREDFPGVDIAVVPASEIRNRLGKHVGVRQVYFPLTDEKTDAIFRALGGSGALSASTPEAHLLNEIQRDAAVINDSDPLFRFVVETSDAGQAVRIEPRGPEAEGVTLGRMKFAFSTEDADATAAFDRFRRDMEAGRPATVDGRYVELENYRFAHLMPGGFDQLTIEPRVPARRIPVRLSARRGTTEAALNFVDLRLVRAGKSEVEFSNQEQGAPGLVSLVLGETAPATFSVTVGDYAGLRPSDVIATERFLNVLSGPGARIELTSLENGATLGSATIPGENEFSESRLQYFEDLALIESRLDSTLVIPDDVHDSDPYAVAEIARMLRDDNTSKEGTVEGNLVPRDKAEFMRVATEQPEALTFVQTGTQSVTLFGRVYEFDARLTINEPIEILEERADGSITVRMHGRIEVTYSNGRIAPGADPAD